MVQTKPSGEDKLGMRGWVRERRLASRAQSAGQAKALQWELQSRKSYFDSADLSEYFLVFKKKKNVHDSLLPHEARYETSTSP